MDLPDLKHKNAPREVPLPHGSISQIPATPLEDAKDLIVFTKDTLAGGKGSAMRERIVQRTLLFQFVYSIVGLVIGLASMILGAMLFLNSVAGETSWSVQILGSESELSDAAPGSILFVVGLFVVWVTRYSVRVAK